MEESHSSRRYRDVKDVLTFFEGRLQQWNDTIKNLKENEKIKEERHWIPNYLYDQMEEIEKICANTKIQIPFEKGNKVRSEHEQGNIPECCQRRIKEKRAEIEQLEKNNATLMTNQQIAEREVDKLKKELQLKEKQLKGNDKCTQAGFTGKEKSDQIEVEQQDAKQVEEGQSGRNINPEQEANTPECCQAVMKKKNADINRLNKKHDELLLQTQQAADKQYNDLKKTVEEIQQKGKETTRKDKSVQTDMTRKEQSDQTKAVQQDAKESSQPLKKHRSVANNMPNDGDKEKLNEMEEEYRKDASELKTLKEKFGTDLEEHIVKLQKENKDLKTRFESSHRRDTGDAEQRHQQEVKHNKDEQRSNDLKEQQMQRQQEGKKMGMTRNDQLKMQENNQMLSAINGSLETRVKELEKEIKSYEHVLGKVREEKDNLLLRLSKFAGDKLTENNPAIADLSDPNRPTKLAEFYSELYDNEWTDAFEALKGAGYEDRVAVETLKLTFLNTMQYCESKANHLMQKSTDAVNFLFGETGRTSPEMKVPSHATMPQKQAKEMGVLFREKSSIEDVKFQQRWMPVGRRNARDGKSSSEKSKTEKNTKKDVVSKLNLLRKEMAIHMIPIVQKAYMETNWSKEYIEELKPYILKCIFMSWMMLVQSPPMSLHKLPGDKEVRFDKNIYKEYITSGPLVSYVVWPALLLNEGGPLLCKGVAEGKQPSK